MVFSGVVNWTIFILILPSPWTAFSQAFSVNLPRSDHVTRKGLRQILIYFDWCVTENQQYLPKFNARFRFLVFMFIVADSSDSLTS